MKRKRKERKSEWKKICRESEERRSRKESE